MGAQRTSDSISLHFEHHHGQPAAKGWDISASGGGSRSLICSPCGKPGGTNRATILCPSRSTTMRRHRRHLSCILLLSLHTGHDPLRAATVPPRWQDPIGSAPITAPGLGLFSLPSTGSFISVRTGKRSARTSHFSSKSLLA